MAHPVLLSEPRDRSPSLQKDYIGAVSKAEAERLLRDRLGKIDRGERFEAGKPRTVADLYKALHAATATQVRSGNRKADGLKWRWAH